MNCQGLSNKIKRADTLNFLKGKNYSVYMLQNAHFTYKETIISEHSGALNATLVTLLQNQE